MRKACVGIYWTLPVNWAGFRDLPPSVGAAAAASKSIRDQRERVQRHVRETGGHLIATSPPGASATGPPWPGCGFTPKTGCAPPSP